MNSFSPIEAVLAGGEAIIDQLLSSQRLNRWHQRMKAGGLLFAAFAASFCGCAPYNQHNPSGVPISEMRTDERGFPASADIESEDIPAVAHKMAREILSTPEIANAKGVPRIVLLPLKNDTRLPINKEILLERIMATLNEKSSGKVLFLARERVELERERDSIPPVQRRRFHAHWQGDRQRPSHFDGKRRLHPLFLYAHRSQHQRYRLPKISSNWQRKPRTRPVSLRVGQLPPFNDSTVRPRHFSLALFHRFAIPHCQS